MYKTIVPDLVTFDTDLSSLNGFIMCQNFNFYKNSIKKAKYHYKLVLTDKTEVPVDYDFKSEYYTKKNNCWYYDRKIFCWKPFFKYDFVNKIFYFNKDYLFLPLKIGGIFTLGEHVCNLIDLEIFLDGYLILRGVAYQKNNKNIAISAPGFNGKSTLLGKLLSEKCGYIAEDYLILNFSMNKIFPTCPLAKKNFWHNRKIDKNFSKRSHLYEIIKEPIRLDKLYLVQNSKNISYQTKRKSLADALLLNSLYFINNLFIKSFIYERGLTEKLFNQIQKYKTIKQKYEFKIIKNFSFPF